MKLTLIYCQEIRNFSQKARARTFAQITSKPKKHTMYIILSLHAKNQPPTTILSYV